LIDTREGYEGGRVYEGGRAILGEGDLERVSHAQSEYSRANPNDV